MSKQSPMGSGKSYLQFHVPLDRRAGWYRALKAALGGVRGTRWQDGHFHVTVAFINDGVDVAGAGKLAEVMDGELAGMAAPVLSFDTLEAFTTQGGEGCIQEWTLLDKGHNL